jgi:RNA polymerase sigma-70 factor, ECF subfamily
MGLSLPTSMTLTRGEAHPDPHVRASIRSLFDAHAPFVFRVLRHLGVEDSALDDATQDVFLVLHRRIDELRGADGARTWLWGVARRVASQYRRRSPRRRERPLEEAAATAVVPDAMDAVASDQARVLLYAILDTLPPEQRDVFILAEIEEVPMREVTTAVGIPLQTGYSRLRLARAKVDEAIARLHGGRQESG